ncbi:MAG: hypothetical protein JXO22_10320 [Phycisphaerae bacterium]|nr:hypothetical protein [Phycisphaerae bacterium]
MPRFPHSIAAFVVSLMALNSAGAAAQSNDEKGATGEDQAFITIKVTDRMVRGAVGRVADQMADRYRLDPYQRERTREVLIERVTTWMQDNREAAEPVINAFIEYTTSAVPPSATEVAGWAKDAMPVLDDLVTLTDEITGDMRDYLSEDQLAELEVDTGAIRAVADVAGDRLERWGGGEFDQETEWVHGIHFKEGAGREDEQLRNDIERAREEAIKSIRSGRPPVAVAEALKQRGASKDSSNKDAWAAYVEEFIRKYALNEEQASKARTILKRSQEQRDDWLSRRSEAFDSLLAEQAKAKTEDEVAKVIVEAERLMQPIESIEKRMKDSLNKLPTRAQRQQAQESEAKPSAQP